MTIIVNPGTGVGTALGTYAGQWGPQSFFRNDGGIARFLPAGSLVGVYTDSAATILATLYTDDTKAATAGNPVEPDANGNVTFYADPGNYWLKPTVNSTDLDVIAVEVPFDPRESVAATLRAGTNTWASKQTFSDEIEVDGALNHDGTTAGFFGVTPATRPAATDDIKDGLASLGLLTNGSASPLNLDAGKLTCGEANIVGALNHDGATAGFGAATPVAVPASSTSDLKDLLVSLGLLTTGGATPLDLDGGTVTAGAANVSGTLAAGAINVPGVPAGNVASTAMTADTGTITIETTLLSRAYTVSSLTATRNILLVVSIFGIDDSDDDVDFAVYRVKRGGVTLPGGSKRITTTGANPQGATIVLVDEDVPSGSVTYTVTVTPNTGEFGVIATGGTGADERYGYIWPLDVGS